MDISSYLNQDSSSVKKYLALSNNYLVYNICESVYLKPLNDNIEYLIGDFYGDPHGAIFGPKEEWIFMYGCGSILYYIRHPFCPYKYNYLTEQWWEFGRDNEDIWWIENAYQLDSNYIRLVIDPYSEKAGIYDLSIDRREISRLIPK